MFFVFFCNSQVFEVWPRVQGARRGAKLATWTAITSCRSIAEFFHLHQWAKDLTWVGVYGSMLNQQSEVIGVSILCSFFMTAYSCLAIGVSVLSCRARA